MPTPPPNASSMDAPRRKNRLGGSVGAALLILAAVVAYFAIGTLTAQDDGPAVSGPADDPRPPFEVVTIDAVTSQRPVTVTLAGRTEAGRRVTVRAETAGQVIAMPAREGAVAERGDALCQLDTSSRAAVLAEAEATLAKATADYNAAKRLFEEGFSSEAGLNTARAALDSARARVSQAQRELNNVRIDAPFRGLVAETLVEPGDFLPAGGACAVLADFGSVVIAGGVTATDASLLEPGYRGLVRIDGQPDFPAEVSFVSEVADLRTRAFRVELTADGRQGLTDGLDAVVVVTGDSRSAIQIPRNALVFHDDGRLGVRTVTPRPEIEGQGDVAFWEVEIVGEDDNGLFVSGIPPEAKVIARGQDYVKAGARVRYRPRRESEG